MSWVGYWSDPRFESDYIKSSIEHYVARVRGLVPLSAERTVLDYGAGQGYLAEYLASGLRRLHLVEPSSSAIERARARYQRLDNVAFHELAGGEALRRAIAPGSVDLILVNSVFQYVPEADLPELFAAFADVLAPGGVVLVSDVVTPGYSLLRDVVSTFRHYRRWGKTRQFVEHFLLELKLVQKRRGMQVIRHSLEELERVAGKHFTLERRDNPTVCSNRLCVLFKKRV